MQVTNKQDYFKYLSVSKVDENLWKKTKFAIFDIWNDFHHTQLTKASQNHLKLF